MKPGDIIQIIDEQDPWYPCLLIVSELKSWGVQAYVLIPNEREVLTGQAYRRMKKGLYEPVGVAVIVAGGKKNDTD